MKAYLRSCLLVPVVIPVIVALGAVFSATEHFPFSEIAAWNMLAGYAVIVAIPCYVAYLVISAPLVLFTYWMGLTGYPVFALVGDLCVCLISLLSPGLIFLAVRKDLRL